jgi:ribosomal protein S18 acetylase RimI-like enzyme
VSGFYSQALAQQDRSAFSCGNDRIDSYFRFTVSQDVKRGYARCYVIVERDSEKLAGFYTLSSSSFPLTGVLSHIAKKLPRYPTVPAILIGGLGRDVGFRGQKIGEMLLDDALKRVALSPAGAYAMIADAIDDSTAAFYREHLFAPLLDSPNRLYLPLANLPAPRP